MWLNAIEPLPLPEAIPDATDLITQVKNKQGGTWKWKGWGSSPLSLEPVLGPVFVRPMTFDDYTLILHNIPLQWITMLTKDYHALDQAQNQSIERTHASGKALYPFLNSPTNWPYWMVMRPKLLLAPFFNTTTPCFFSSFISFFLLLFLLFVFIINFFHILSFFLHWYFLRNFRK